MATRIPQGGEPVRHAGLPERWRLPDEIESERAGPTPAEFLKLLDQWKRRSVGEKNILHASVSDGFVMGRHIKMFQKWEHLVEEFADPRVLAPTSPDNVFLKHVGPEDPFTAGFESLGAVASTLWPFLAQISELAQTALQASEQLRDRLKHDASAVPLMSYDARKLIALLVVRAERTQLLTVPVTPAELEGVYAWVVSDACSRAEAHTLLKRPRRSAEAWRTSLAEHRGRVGGKPIHRANSSEHGGKKTSRSREGFVESLERRWGTPPADALLKGARAVHPNDAEADAEQKAGASPGESRPATNPVDSDGATNPVDSDGVVPSSGDNKVAADPK